jgi:hypothetical protein
MPPIIDATTAEQQIPVVEGLVAQLACCSARLNKVVDKLGHIIAKFDHVIERQDLVADALAGLREAHTDNSALAKSLQTKAQQMLAASEAEAAPYREALNAAAPVDPTPFEAVPAGTTARDLPDGGRLFTFSDGHLIRVSPEGTLVAIGPMGEAGTLPVARNRKVTMSTGRELVLRRGSVMATHEAVGISGLPVDVEPLLVGPNRYRIDLDGDLRLELDQTERRLLVINPSGSLLQLGGRIEGIGEKVEVRFVPGGARGFTASDTGHGGMVEPDGTIHLSLASGADLVVRFPDPPADSGAPGARTFTCGGCS